MTTILGAWELGRNFGHVAHVASLARAMARRGGVTHFAARDLLTAAQVPDRPFARTLQAPLHHRPPPLAPTLTYGQAIGDGGMTDPDAATVLVAAWLQIFDSVRPDAVVCEFAPAAQLAAHIAGIRWARTGSAWSVPPATAPLPGLTPWLPDDPAARAAADAAADETVRIVCRRFAARPLGGLPALLAEGPRLLGTWPEFDHYGPQRGAVYYGPMSGLAATARPGWPAGDGPRVFVYLPGDHRGATPLGAALTGLGWPTLWHGAVAPRFALPATIVFAENPVDLGHVLGQAALVAGRGGHATACQALRAGKPQLILPDTLEVSLLGWRLQRQGFARLLSEAPPAAEITAALVDLAADAGIAAAVANGRARYLTYDPVAAEDAMAADFAAALGL